MIRFESSAHWYSREAEPQHDADLRIARKKFLYPSVTTINKDVFKNDFLDRWKMDQLATAAAANFRQPHESDEGYANRIYEISLTKTREAASFGKTIHAAIEEYPKYPMDAAIHPWLDAFGKWYNDSVECAIHRERVLLDHDLGVAGTCDFIGLGRGALAGCRIIPDWKTQDVKKDPKTGKKKPAFYDDWARQLAFYAVADAKAEGRGLDDLPTCISVIIDSNEACDPFVRVWKKEEILDAYMDFVAGAYLWFSKRGYWPQVIPFRLNPTVPLPA
jgi:hypothetical protein